MRRHAAAIWKAALDAADPAKAVARFLRVEGDRLVAGRRAYDLPRAGNVYVAGAGKASPAMAQAVERMLGSRITGGTVVTKYGHSVPLKRISIQEAGHPVPDAAGVEGARRLAQLAAEAGEGDLIVFLISGGGSALTPSPAPPITLADKQLTTRLLLECGADIHEINAVRKHISTFKGGQLARLAAPATVVTLMLSDVIGDHMGSIASGPTVPDPTTFAGAWAIVEKYDLAARIPSPVRDRLESGAAGRIPDTPKADDPAFARTQNIIVGSNRLAVDAAAAQAKKLGYHTLVLSTLIEGETRDVARMHAAIAKEIIRRGRPARQPACVISGGETTVTIRGGGLGGRNQEFALAAGIDLAGEPDAVAVSIGTDGTDGPTDAAGAIADGHTVDRARGLGLNPAEALAANDSYHFFERLGDLIKTGPTGTNVMDVRLMLAGLPR
jgi:hydroxypyruvate reductase